MVLLRLFLDICLLRKAPQDLPASRFLLQLTVIFYVIAGFLLLIAMASGWIMALIQITIELALNIGFTYGVLTASRKRTRFYQTLTALLGTDAFISLCSVPISGFGMGTGAMGPAELLIWAMVIWRLVVTGHIFRHALSKPLGYGMAVAAGLIFLIYVVLGALFAGAQ